jgi:hypothetical protein
MPGFLLVSFPDLKNLCSDLNAGYWPHIHPVKSGSILGLTAGRFVPNPRHLPLPDGLFQAAVGTAED